MFREIAKKRYLRPKAIEKATLPLSRDRLVGDVVEQKRKDGFYPRITNPNSSFNGND